MMSQSISIGKRIRKNFGHINLVASIPNLIEVQKNSYEKEFLQFGVKDSDRVNKGLQSVLSSIFPIHDAWEYNIPPLHHSNTPILHFSSLSHY